MVDERPPARPWFDLVMEEMSTRGWGIAELANRAGISRPTVYGWRDNMNKPRAAPVNAVADVLGIPRKQALRAAGVITQAGTEPPEDEEPEGELPTPEELARLREHIREVLGEGSPLEASLDAVMSGEPTPTKRGKGAGAGRSASSARRRARRPS